MNPWLRVIVSQRFNGLWEARGLERDIAAEGRTIEQAIGTVLDLVFAHIAYDGNHGRTPLSAFPRAPGWYWEVADLARPIRSLEYRGLPITILTPAHRVPAHLMPRAAQSL
jgi:hypothetical protein